MIKIEVSAMARSLARKSVALLILVLLPPSVAAQWSGVGTLQRPEEAAGGLLYRGGTVTISVTAVSPEIVRVRLARGSAFGRDHSYAVLPQQRATPRFSARPGIAESTIETDALRVVIKQNPFQLEFFSKDGTS